MAEGAEVSNKKKICIIGGVVVLLLVAGIVGFIVIKNKKADEGTGSTNSEAEGGEAKPEKTS
ncbi:hypothetical protein NEAUS03_2387 [Nematocida ausubeli]|nr:hypothetical protein NEAUS03_2387 [Nematocida ausubeli]